MHKKDYVAIAQSFKAATKFDIYNKSYEARSMHALMANEMAVHLKADNERFERGLFLTACGLDGGTIDAL